MRLLVTDHLRRHLSTWDGDGNMSELARRASEHVGRPVHPDTFHRIMRGEVDSLQSRNAEALAAGLGLSVEELVEIALGRGGDSARQVSEGSTARPVRVRTCKVFGMAQAKGISQYHGDLKPDSRWECPDIEVPDDGRRYAAFTVEGDSMAGKMDEGDIALCDLDAEVTNGCYAVTKYNDDVVIKRWRRLGDTVLLESVNPDYEPLEVHARDIEWKLRVRRVVREV